MKAGELVNVRARVAFEKNQVTDYQGNVKEGVVSRGFEIIEGQIKWEGLVFLDLPEDVGMGMPKGTIHHLCLKRRSLKKDKDATLPASWNYDLEKQGEVETQPAKAEPNSGKVVEPPTDPLAQPTLHPAADKYGGAGVIYSEWRTDRRTALLTARDRAQDGWTAYDLLEEAEMYFKWLRGAPLSAGPDVEIAEPEYVPPEP